MFTDCVSFASGLIISSLFGDAYLPYKTIIPFIILAQGLGFYVRYLNIALRTLKHTIPIFMGYAITAVLSILSSEKLITHFGFLGYGVGIIIFNIILISFLFWRIRIHAKNLDDSILIHQPNLQSKSL